MSGSPSLPERNLNELRSWRPPGMDDETWRQVLTSVFHADDEEYGINPYAVEKIERLGVADARGMIECNIAIRAEWNAYITAHNAYHFPDYDPSEDDGDE